MALERNVARQDDRKELGLFDVSGALLLNVDGEDIALCASGSDIVIEVRRPRRLLKQIGSPWRGRRIVRSLANGLNEVGLTLTVTRNGIAILTLGAEARTSFLGRLVGIEHVSLR